MPLDLTSAKNFLEGEMVDTITVIRDVQRNQNDAFDQATGTYASTVNDKVTVVDGTVDTPNCMIIPKTRLQGGDVQGEVQREIKQYTLWMKLDSPDLHDDDEVVIVACPRWPERVGQVFYVTGEVETTTFAVGRKYDLRKPEPREFPHGR